jgi:flagellar basal-body rod protein FlgG
LLEGMYSAAAGMAAQQQRLDAVANDLANVNTTGYKHVRLAFRDLIYANGARGADKSVRLGAGSAATSIGRSAAQGALKNTGEALDVALRGPGFISVLGADGKPALTRDGALRIDARNRLVAGGAGLVLQPPVVVPAGTVSDDVHITADGNVNVRGRTIGAIRLVTVPAPAQLAGGPDNTFSVTSASGAAQTAGRGTTIAQGMLESSNADVSDAMVDMIDAQRSYQMASKVIQVQDQVLEIANGVKK